MVLRPRDTIAGPIFSFGNVDPQISIYPLHNEEDSSNSVNYDSSSSVVAQQETKSENDQSYQQVRSYIHSIFTWLLSCIIFKWCYVQFTA